MVTRFGLISGSTTNATIPKTRPWIIWYFDHQWYFRKVDRFIQTEVWLIHCLILQILNYMPVIIANMTTEGVYYYLHVSRKLFISETALRFKNTIAIIYIKKLTNAIFNKSHHDVSELVCCLFDHTKTRTLLRKRAIYCVVFHQPWSSSSTLNGTLELLVAWSLTFQCSSHYVDSLSVTAALFKISTITLG